MNYIKYKSELIIDKTICLAMVSEIVALEKVYINNDFPVNENQTIKILNNENCICFGILKNGVLSAFMTSHLISLKNYSLFCTGKINEEYLLSSSSYTNNDRLFLYISSLINKGCVDISILFSKTLKKINNVYHKIEFIISVPSTIQGIKMAERNNFYLLPSKYLEKYPIYRNDNIDWLKYMSSYSVLKEASPHEMRDSSMTLNLSRYESGWY